MSLQSSERLEQKMRGERGYFKYSLFHMSSISLVYIIYTWIQCIIL